MGTDKTTRRALLWGPPPRYSVCKGLAIHYALRLAAKPQRSAEPAINMLKEHLKPKKVSNAPNAIQNADSFLRPDAYHALPVSGWYSARN